MPQENHCINSFQTMEFVYLTETPFLDSFLIPGLIDNKNEAMIIYILSENQMTIKQKYLYNMLNVSRPAITTLTEGLIRKGLIEQKITDKDHRGYDIHLTKLGSKVGKWMLFRRCHINQIQLKGFSPEEIKLLNNFDSRMAMNLLDASDRELRNLPKYEDFNEKMVSKIPTAISQYDKKQFISLISRVKNQN